MVRLEQQLNSDNEMNEMKDEIKQLKKELHKKQNKKILSCSHVFILVIILLVIGAVYGAYLLAKSGLMNVPFFTQRFYQTPQPVYIVETKTAPAENLIDWLKKQVAAQAASSGKAVLVITDAQITTYLNDALAKDSQTLSSIQAAITNDEIELFFTFIKPLYVIIGVIPKAIADGEVEFDVVRVEVGNVELPDFVGDQLLENLIFKRLAQLKNLVFKNIVIKAINLKTHEVSLDLTINQ